MRCSAALILCALVVGAAALPSTGLRSRRALRQEEPETIFGEPVQYLTFKNTCDNNGVDFRLRFSFGKCCRCRYRAPPGASTTAAHGEYPWFSKEVTDVIPGPFVDYFCDNIGTVNYQFEGPENRMNDSSVQEAIRNGTCFNEQVLLRWPSWQGHGPQKELGLEFPNGTVSDLYFALNHDENSDPIVPLDAGIEGSGWRTANGAEECAAGQEGCKEWFKVNLDSLNPTVTFVCGAKPAAQMTKLLI